MKIFWSFTRQAFQFIAAYRFNFFMEFVLVILRMYGIYWVWRILYTQRPGAFGVSLEQMTTYGVMGMRSRCSSGRARNGIWPTK